MKPIKSIKQLNSEKALIHERLVGLEYKIQNQWIALKADLTPANMIKNTLHSIINKKAEPPAEKESLLKTVVHFGLDVLVNSLANKAGEKLGQLLTKKK